MVPEYTYEEQIKHIMDEKTMKSPMHLDIHRNRIAMNTYHKVPDWFGQYNYIWVFNDRMFDQIKDSYKKYNILLAINEGDKKTALLNMKTGDFRIDTLARYKLNDVKYEVRDFRTRPRLKTLYYYIIDTFRINK